MENNFNWIWIAGIVAFIFALMWLFIGIDVSGKPLQFQINCNPENTECHVSSEDTQGNNYGLMAVNHDYYGNAFNYTISKGNCTIKSVDYTCVDYHTQTNATNKELFRTECLRLDDMEVGYSYEVICYSMGTLKLEELWK